MPHSRKSPRLTLFAVIVAIAAAVSCDAPVVNQADGVDHIVLTPTTATIEAGATVSLFAQVFDAAGGVMRDRRVVWASENDAIASVSQSGVVTAVAPGRVQIAASSGGKSASASVAVIARPVSLVRVIPGSGTIAVNGSLTLRAEALDAIGEPVEGAVAEWESTNEAVASVSGEGVVTGVAPGGVTIRATVAGRAGTAAIVVAPQPVASVRITQSADTIVVGGRTTFRAEPLDAQNSVLPDRVVLWSSSNTSIAAVSSEGEVFGLAVGSARIRATVEGRFAEAGIAVKVVPVASIAVTPNNLNLTPGQTSQLTVTPKDSAGNTLQGRAVTYATSDPHIASVSTNGLVIAVAEGSAQIDISCEGVTASVSLIVSPAPIATISVTPNASSLRIGQNVQLVAQARDARGTALTGRGMTWTSSAPNVASVSQAGIVSAVGVGSATISASAEGKQGSAAVSVTHVPAVAVVISPDPVTLQQAQTQQLTLQLFDSAGGSLSPSGRFVAWTSRDPAVATVSLSGLVTAVAPGNTHVTVVTANATDSIVVTVAAAPVATLSVQPAGHTMSTGETRALRAVVSSGGSVVRSGSVSWQSRGASIVSVAAVSGWPDSAVVSAVSLGSAYVIASDAAGASDSALITVQAVPVATVTVTPAASTISVSGTVQLSAVAQDAAGTPLPQPIAWASGDPAIVSVSSAGLATANAAGSTTVEARATGAGVNGADVVGTATITVTQNVTKVAVHSVTVTSPRSYVVPSDTMHLTVVLHDAQNNVLTGRVVTFSSSAPTRMAVDAAGVVTGLSTSGNHGIVVTSEGKSANINVRGSDAVARISARGPANGLLDLLIRRSSTKRYTVTVEDANGRGIGGVAISVASSDASVLSVSAASITTSGSGRATVDVSAGTNVGAATITFAAIRAGAIPPGTPGNNTPRTALLIVVP